MSGSDLSSSLLPPSSSFLEIKETEEFGRGIYSKRTLSPGTDVIVSVPFAYVVSDARKEWYCQHCLKRDYESLLKCSKCKFVRYCNKACQRKDWLYHKVECPGIPRISPSIPTNTVRLIVRLLVRRSNRTSTVTSLPKGAQWDMDILTTSGLIWHELEQCILEVRRLKLMPNHDNVESEIVYKIFNNSFNILDEDMNSIGQGVYILPSLLNHSCIPNCTYFFDGCKMRVRTIKEVSQNDQLFISYIGLVETREKRQDQLQTAYLFSCNCDRCSSEFSGSLDEKLVQTAAVLGESDEMTLYGDGFSRLAEAKSARNEKNWHLLESLASEYLTEHSTQLGDTNILSIKMRECLMDSYSRQKEWRKAYEVAVTLTEQYVELFDYGSLGHHYFKMSEFLQHYVDTESECDELITLLEKTIPILSVTFGEMHHWVKSRKKVLESYKAMLRIVK